MRRWIAPAPLGLRGLRDGKMIRHIFWDFDGTLFDTYPAMASAYQKALADGFGIQEEACAIEGHMRVSMGHMFVHYAQKHSLPAYLPLFDAYQKEAEVRLTKPYPAIPTLLRSLCGKGIKLYIYTHRDAASTEAHLQKHGLYDVFTDILTVDSGFPRKPDPQALLHMLGKHGISPAEALMVGDRELDVLAAKNAGMYACLYTADAKSPSAADYRLGDFALFGACVADLPME